MIIKALGPGCSNCKNLERVTRQAVDDLGIDATVEKVTDYPTIAGYGVLSTPALVVDEKLVLSGRVPTVSHLRDILSQGAPLPRSPRAFVRKWQRRPGRVNQIVLSLASRGLTTGEISAHFAQVDDASISKDPLRRTRRTFPGRVPGPFGQASDAGAARR